MATTRRRKRPTLAYARPFAEAVTALLLYIAVTAYITWPFADHPTTTLLDNEGSDWIGGAVRYRELAQYKQAPFLPGTMPDLNAPEGLPTSWLVELAAAPSATATWLLAIAFGGIGGVGLFSVASFFLSAFSMYLLVRWVTGHAGVAFVAGFAFGFWPYAYTYFRFPLGHAWVLVLLVWRMLALIRHTTLRNGVYAGLAAVFAMWWTHYWLLIGAVLYATLAAVALVVGGGGTLRRRVGSQLVATTLIAVFVGGLVAFSVKAGFADVPQRSEANFVEFSARPLMYLLPRDSFVGRWTAPVLAERFAGPAANPASTASYSPIYLGVTTLVLAAFGWAWLISKIIRHRGGILTDLQVIAGVAATAALLVALAFSAPPEFSFGSLSIPLPGHFVAQVAPQFRFSSRFAQVVMLGLCVVAGIGLREVIRGRRRFTQRLIIAIVLGLVAVDLRSGQYLTPIQNGIPPLYGDLRGQPAGIAAEYPLRRASLQDTNPLLFQQAHRHPVFNGAAPMSPSESRKAELQDLTDPRTPAILRRYGVRYVVVRRLPIARQFDYSGVRRSIPGLLQIHADRYGGLYKITAAPARAVVAASAGFELPEFSHRGFARWTNASPAVVEVIGDCRVCSGTLELRVKSFYEPRRLVIRDERGQILARRTVPVVGALVRIPLRFSRRTALSLTTDPGPRRVGAVAGTGDARTLGIEVRRRPLHLRPHRP